MKILVPVKQIASLDEDFELLDDATGVDPDYLDYELNEWDDFSYEEALRIMEANEAEAIEVVPVTVGPEEADDALRRCLAKGGERGIRIWDDAIVGSDPGAIAGILAKVVEREQPDLVLAGTLSSDHAFAQTGMILAARLGWSHAAVVNHLELKPGSSTATIHRELEGGLEEKMSIDLPAVLTIQLGINEPRYASLRGIKQAKRKEIEILSHEDVGLTDDDVGVKGSLSRVRRMLMPEKGRAEFIEGTSAEKAARLTEIIKDLQGAA